MFERLRGQWWQAKRATRHGRRNGRDGRRLAMESLENRTMLSCQRRASPDLGPRRRRFQRSSLWGCPRYRRWSFGSGGAGQQTTGTVASQFAVSLPQNVPNGLPVTVLVRAEDAQGDFASSYSGTASLTSSDSAATFPTTVTFHHGFATLQVTFATAGSQSLTLTDSSSTQSITGTASTTVATPDVATQYAITLPTAVPNGSAVRVFVEALDAQGHVVQNYSGTANVTSTDTAAKLPASVTFQHGFASFTATFATSGPQSLTLTDSKTSTLTSTVNTTVSAPDVATQYAITLPSAVANDAPVTVRVERRWTPKGTSCGAIQAPPMSFRPTPPPVRRCPLR